MGQNGQKKLERWAVNSLQLGFSSPKSAYLGCVGHLDIVKNNTRAQKTKKNQKKELRLVLGSQNSKKVEFWAVYSLQLWFSSLKSAHLGCYGHLDIMNISLLKTGELFVALRIFGALREVPKMENMI